MMMNLLSIILSADIGIEWSNILGARLFGMELYDNDLIELMSRFAINLLSAVIIIRYLYYSITKRKDYLFTYLLISTTIFLLCFILENVKLDMAFAFGLFAIFGILRYRTQQIPIKEMTYLFIVIGLAVVNALAGKKISYAELLFTNLAIIALIFILEKVWLLKHESQKVVIYEKIDLIVPKRKAELLADLEKRTGIKISRVEIGKINFMKDTCRIVVFYFESDNLDIAPDDTFAQLNNRDV